jgi:2-polyprenyl-3-methyl-5-hydroxy-6-metoxy-1,4-benzoquinol methylase
MSRKSFENYGTLAELVQDSTRVAGRYKIQESAERNILWDVVQKLKLGPDDTLLDIGCNAGNLTIPLSFLVAETTGIDHPRCLHRLRKSFPEGIELIAGNFLDLSISMKFTRILCYTVLQYLSDLEEVTAFVDKAVSLLRPGGRALFGDLPNRSLKKRFLESSTGQDFSIRWEELRKRSSGEELPFDPDPVLVNIDDESILTLMARYRARGYESYVLAQPPDLPFGRTREDLLIVAHA